jgi:outer membrane lipoprotein
MTYGLRFLAAGAVLALAACASGPKFDAAGAEPSVSPRQVAVNEEQFLDARVVWGGLIVSSTNLENATEIEVLAYPLNSSQRPQLDQTPLGRFLVMQDGYLETVTFSRDRVITVTGTVRETVIGRVGDSEYVYPVVHTDGLYLWSRADRGFWDNVSVGVGVSVHN